jgi:hypothetical protein
MTKSDNTDNLVVTTGFNDKVLVIARGRLEITINALFTEMEEQQEKMREGISTGAITGCTKF